MNKDNAISTLRRPRQPQNSLKKSQDKKQKQIKKENVISQNDPSSTKQNRGILHNNWIINNQILKDSNNKSQRQPSNKSVIVVKPNHTISQPIQMQNASRTSLRKTAGSQRKIDKDDVQPNKKFFANEVNDFFPEKTRSSSVKQQRKQGLASSIIMKNASLSGKGKWKL